MKSPLAKVSLRTALIYAVVGAAWILFSGWLLDAFVSVPEIRDRLEIYKGWVFVLVMALLLYTLLRGQLGRWEQDVTARKRAEEDLKESNQRLQQITLSLHEAVYLRDAKTRQILYINPAFEKICGISCESFLKNPEVFTDIIHPDDKQRVLESREGAFSAGEVQDVEHRIIHPRKNIRWVRGQMFPVKNEKGEVYRLARTLEDITDRKGAEEELRRLNRSLQTLSKCNEVVVRATDESTLLTKVCQLITEIGGFRLAWVGYMEQDENKSVRPVAWAGPEAGYVEHLRVSWADTDRGHGPSGAAIRTGQPTIFSDLAGQPDFVPWREAALRHGFGSSIGLPLKVDNKIVGALAVYSSEADPFSAAETALLTELADDLGFGIAALRSRDRGKQLEEQLRQSQKMEAIGQLAGGVAHDFNNLLTIIQGNATLCLNPQLDPGEKSNCSHQIVQAAERAASLTRQLLIFSRKQVMRRADVDLNELVGNMTKMLRRILGEDIVLHTSYSSHPAFIHADTGMIEQVLMNLIINARDAMSSGGQLSISTGGQEIPQAQIEKNPDALAGPHVCLTVSDTGCGISKETMPRIFEPFFTTKEVGRGTGLGLATVYAIVQQHHGWVAVTSEVGRGTTFHVYLPAAKGVPVKSEALTAPQLPRGDETILVAEDEPAVRSLVNNFLRRCGYTVLTAESGVAALEVWKGHRDKIQLLLTDMIMPDGMTGFDLAQRLRSEQPELKVVYTSGYSADIFGKDSTLIRDGHFLQKPYHPHQLAQTVRDCLDQQPSDG
jgi:PAS domain S-box-containing protein